MQVLVRKNVIETKTQVIEQKNATHHPKKKSLKSASHCPASYPLKSADYQTKNASHRTKKYKS